MKTKKRHEITTIQEFYNKWVKANPVDTVIMNYNNENIKIDFLRVIEKSNIYQKLDRDEAKMTECEYFIEASETEPMFYLKKIKIKE